MTLFTYDSVKQAAMRASISPLTLEELKVIFKAQIASKRRYDCIRSIGELIDVLERRDALSECNIGFIHELSNRCGSSDLQEALKYYCTPRLCTQSPLRLENEYREIRLAETLKENLRIPRNTANSESFNGCTMRTASCVGLLTDDKRRAIYKKLCKELGKDWRNFGRELHITEGDLDNIESQSHDLTTRIAKTLKIFEEDESNDPQRHFLSICHALDECPRKDLRRAVENIMSY